MYDQLYLDSQRRVIDLISPLSADDLDRRTPACPRWSVRDVLAHLADGEVSFVDGGVTVPDGNPCFVGDEVGVAAGRSLAELVSRWQRHAPELTQIPLASQSWRVILHETLTHEADIRGAIGAPRLPADALAAAWPLLTEVIRHQLAPLGTVLLKLDEQPLMVGDGLPDVAVEATLFDFWRAWFGRRSPAQIRGWVRAGDADRFARTLPLFPARQADLVELG